MDLGELVGMTPEIIQKVRICSPSLISPAPHPSQGWKGELLLSSFSLGPWVGQGSQTAAPLASL